MKKKVIVLLWAVILCCTLAAGCGKKNTLADGTYTADFNTDSSMFHVNEAYDGKGILTVENGQMTIHVSMPSKNIVNLYLGSAEDAENLYKFGMQIGVAFQLQDDLLDVYGDPEVFGKKIGGDILCNKKTYMLIKALDRADAKQREELNRWLDAETCQPAEKIKAVTELYNQLDIRSVCENKMRGYYTLAMESLAAVGVAEERKKELKNLVKLLMYREM